jgi:diguanylate cyclase (GGDEF)-like protein
VPLVADGEPLGLALLSDRASGRFGGDEQAAAQAVADFTAIAARNARRFGLLERFGLRDRETGAYNLAYFVDYAGKEFYKARRYGRAFSLVVVSVDNAEQIRKAAGRELYRRAMHDLVAAVSRVVRDADILAKVSEGEYYVLLPETDTFGALMFQRRATEEIRSEASVRQVEERVPLLLSMGAAAFPKDGEDFDELLHWARARVEAQRGSLVRRLHLGDLPKGAFWELCDLLLADGVRVPERSPSAQLPADPERLEALQREAGREIGRDPRARGLAYLGTASGRSRAPLLAALPAVAELGRADDASVHVVLLGPRGPGSGPVAHPLVSEVFLDGDQRLAGHEFLLFLSEHSAYAHLVGPGGRAFHTADEPLVDLLVAKLQAAYDLQPL